MPKLPWTPGSAKSETDGGVVLISHLPLAKKSATLLFLRKVVAVRGQLKTSPGLVGYTLDAHLVSGHYWTLSWWHTQQHLDDFVKTEPHRGIMSTLAGVMGKTEFHSWTPEAGAARPTWDDARRRLAAASG